MRFIGIDPDLSCLTVALVDESGLLVCIEAFKSKKTGMDAISDICPRVCEAVNVMPNDVASCAIESQEIVYTAKAGRNPRSLLTLAHMSGVLHCACNIAFPLAHVLCPVPSRWKGQVPKGIHQARILGKLGIQYIKMGGKEPYCVPDLGGLPVNNLNRSDWKHGMDSWGLAIWAKDQYKKGL